MRLAGILTALVLIVCPAGAQDMEIFRSPSGNIACSYVDESLRCDVMQVTNRQPKAPSDCELEWGQAFEMTARARHAERICHGDTVFDPDAEVLDYGSSWESGVFSCLSSERGISCRNARGAGWDLSRGAQTLH